MSSAVNGDYAEFKGWMAEFSFGANDELLKQQWAALGTFSKQLDEDDLETLARLALKSRQAPTAESAQKIAELLAADASFSVASNGRELQVLSAVALVRLARTPEARLSPYAALTLATSLVARARKAALPMDLGGVAEAAIDALARGVGRRPTMPTLKQTPRVSFESAAKGIESQQWTEAKNQLTAAGTSTDAAVQALASQFVSVSRFFDKVVRQQDEELQMLWWLLGGRSEDLDVSFGKVKVETQPLVLSKELASHTVLPPGPPSVKALLSRAGVSAKGKVEVAKAIAACELAWLKTLVDGYTISPVTLPIHFGIQRQLEVGSGTEWVANWAAVVGLKADISFDPLTLAEAFYRERLLLQAQ